MKLHPAVARALKLPVDDELLDAGAVARRLSCHISTALRLIKSGALRSYRLAGSRRYVPESEVVRHVLGNAR